MTILYITRVLLSKKEFTHKKSAVDTKQLLGNKEKENKQTLKQF